MPRRAVCLIREALHYRRDAFCDGLRIVGFQVVQALRDPGYDDVLVIWNRYGGYAEQARVWEKAGARVIVAENGYLGKAWRGGDWYALSLNHHSGAGKWNHGGPERWNTYGVEFQPWRNNTGETLILGQRGIGEPGIASPAGWAEKIQKSIGGRVRSHPGKNEPVITLNSDFDRSGQVVTWHSGAALLALIAGLPVWYGFDRWIGGQAGLPLGLYGAEPKKSDTDRLNMFQRLIWAQWTLNEIKEGTAFAKLLGT